MEYLSEIWEIFLLFVNAQPAGWIYFFLFLGSFMENVTPPVPGDTLIVFGAYLAGMGLIGVWPAYLAMFVGSVLGCMLVYALAYWKGRAFLIGLFPRIFRAERLDDTERWFRRYGDKVVVFNRFLPTVRAFVGIVAGVSRMHPVRMGAYVLLGTFMWNSLLVYFGLVVGENWEVVIGALRAYNQVAMGLLVLGAIGFAVWRRRRLVTSSYQQKKRRA